MNVKSGIRYLVAVVGLVFAPACTYVSDAEVSAVSGAIGDAITGSEISGSDRDPLVLGALLGRINGPQVAEALNEEDQRLMAEVAFVLLDHGADGQSKTWRNGHTRHHGSFVLHSTWRSSDRIECRRFTNTIYVGEGESRASGTACQQRDGTWAVMG